MRLTPVTIPHIQATIIRGIPINIIERTTPTIERTTCQIPSLVFPAIRLPNPGKIRILRIKAIIAMF